MRLNEINTADGQKFLNERSHLSRKKLQAIAGHADIQTTMNWYVHQQSDKIVETGRS